MSTPDAASASTHPVPLPAHYQPRTIPALLDQRAAQFQDKCALVVREGTDYVELTYRSWFQQVCAIAATLRLDLNLKAHDRIGWSLSNKEGGAALMLHHAILRIGAVSVPVNTRSSAAEVAAIMTQARTVAWIGADALHATLSTAARSLPAPPRLIEWSQLETLAQPRLGAIEPAADASTNISETDDAVILFSSGTTGKPKGIVHTHASALAAGIGWCDAMTLHQDDILQSPFPVFSGAGLHFNGLAVLWAGGTFVVDDYNTQESMALVQRAGATVYVAVPSIFQYWLAEGDLDKVRGLRALDYGGAMMAPATIEALRKAIPGVDLIQTYGLTEGGPGGVVLPPRYALAKLGSVGNRGMWTHMHFRVLREDGQDAGTDEAGEIVIHGPSLMSRYLDNPEETAAAFVDGWLRTGDIGRLDAEGFLYLIDRKKDLIIRGGYNIAPAEVENALMQCDGVFEAAVIGKPHERLGEDLKAFVVPRNNVTLNADDLRRQLAHLLADFKIPRDFEFVNELPRNAAGKVLRRALRERSPGAAAPHNTSKS